MLLAGLRYAGVESARLGFVALGWVTTEEGMSRLGLDDGRELGAGLGTAAVFAGMCASSPPRECALTKA